MDAPEQIILDVNELAEGQPFMALGAFAISDDNLLAYSTDHTGFRQYTLHIHDLRTGNTLTDTAERVGSIVWANDNTTLFYSIEDEETKRQDQLYRHTLGQPQSPDDVSSSKSPTSASTSASAAPATSNSSCSKSGSHTTSESRFLPAIHPTGELDAHRARAATTIEYYADHRDGLFYIRANDTGRNFRLVTAPVDRPSSKNWRELIPLATTSCSKTSTSSPLFAAIDAARLASPRIGIRDL